jgi:cholesterol oxidase
MTMGVPLNVTEWMKGYVGFGATDCDAGFIEGLDQGASYEHEVVIAMADIDRFIAEPKHMATMEGSITCGRLGGKRPIRNGVYNMLVDDENPDLTFIFYKMQFDDAPGGRAYTALGHKTIENAHALDLLSRIMTLSLRIFEGDIEGPDMATPVLGPPHVGDAKPVAMGVLHIQTLDAFKSAASFASPGSSWLAEKEAVAKFGAFYLGKLWQLYGIGHKSQRPGATAG